MSSGPAGSGVSRRSAALAGAALIVIVLLVFGQVRSFGFVDYDDGDYVFRNPHLSQGPLLERVRWAFGAFHAANWHPVTWLSFIADATLFGLDPGWLHTENLLLHAANAVLLCAVLVRLTGSVGASALAAALFAVHPLRAESVAWVTERKGLLMALYSLLTLQAYVSYARRPTTGRLLAVAGLLTLALMAKPQAVTLPLLLLVFDWWPLGRIGGPASRTAVGRAVREKVPLLVLSAAVTFLVVAAQRQGGALAPIAALSVETRLANAVVAPVRYLALSLWPSGLALAYPLAVQPVWRLGCAAVLLAAISLAVVRWRHARPWLAAGWLGFLVLLAPVTNLFQAGGQSLADRYTYLPHLPLLLLLVWSGRIPAAHPGMRRTVVVAALGTCLLFGVVAHRQAVLWRDEGDLFAHAVAVTSGNWKMHYDLANTLERRGDAAAAERHYRLALEARPDYPEALNNLGSLYGRRGEQERARALFLAAVNRAPGYGLAWFNLGVNREQAGDDTGALEAYGRARALQPANAALRVRLGALLIRQGWTDDGRAECREALRLDPALAPAAACLATPDR
jgi:tetratricopeptide (TPR) repeat protein